MADWNLPATTTTYVNVLASLKDRDLDVAKLFDGVTVTNPVNGMIRWSSANSRLEKWSGSAWVALAATHAINISGSSASTTGNAATATVLQTARTINGISFNGSANITVTANTPQTLTRGGYLTGSNFNGSAATTWAVDATSANTASKVVARDASGNFSAGTITAALAGNASSASTAAACSGNAATATKLATARTINGIAFDGSANITIPTSPPVPGTLSGTAIAWGTNAKWHATVAANTTFSFSSNPAVGTTCLLHVTHTSGTITWPASVRWPSGVAPTLTINRTHIFMFYWDGGLYRGSFLRNYATT